MPNNNFSDPLPEPQVQPKKSPNILEAIFASLLIPGLGHFLQKRFGAAFEFFVFFGVSIFLFYLSGLWAFIFHVPLVLFASLDIALRANPNVKKRNLTILRYTFGPLLLFLMFVVLLGPAVFAAREAARRMQCSCCHKGISLAFHTYHDEYKSFPPAYTVDSDGKPLHSWRVLILPYIEQRELYNKIRLDEPWDSEYNRQFHDVNISLFQCASAADLNPMDKRFPNLRKKGNCYISVVVGEKTAFPGSKTVSYTDIHDAKGDTLLIVERLTPVCWMDPNHEILYETAVLGINKDMFGMGSFHTNGCTTALCDGSVHYLPDDISPELLEAMLTISGKEKIDDWYEKLRRKE